MPKAPHAGRANDDRQEYRPKRDNEVPRIVTERRGGSDDLDLGCDEIEGGIRDGHDRADVGRQSCRPGHLVGSRRLAVRRHSLIVRLRDRRDPSI